MRGPRQFFQSLDNRQGRTVALIAIPLVVAVVALTFGASPYFRPESGNDVSVAGVTVASAPPVGACKLAQPAFCDTFDTASPTISGSRTGDLNSVVWGVSRSTSDDNAGQGVILNWNATTMERCGSSITVGPPRDVQICNGQLVEAVTDGGAVTVLAMYPKQPFDFAGRTGVVAFDVGNDTQDSHAAWPEFVISDQPVPAPHNNAAGLSNFARNSFGISLAAVYQGFVGVDAFGDSWGVDAMFTTSNYAFSGQSFTPVGSVKKSVGDGQLNHVEIRISQTRQEVWATDPGGTTLKPIATADITLPLSRGLVWMEDVHYNANKAPSTQGTHTIVWDNFGFDGPVLARDLGFSVPDATAGGGNIGFQLPAALNIQNVAGIANAKAALLTFNWTPHTQESLTYSVNGRAPHVQAWQFGNVPTYRSYTIAVPVPLGEIQSGTNSISISTASNGTSIANVDLILVGAGGGGSSPGPTQMPVLTATRVPTLVPTSPPTVVATPVPGSSCVVSAVLNATPITYTRPMAFCSNQ